MVDCGEEEVGNRRRGWRFRGVSREDEGKRQS